MNDLAHRLIELDLDYGEKIQKRQQELSEIPTLTFDGDSKRFLIRVELGILRAGQWFTRQAMKVV